MLRDVFTAISRHLDWFREPGGPIEKTYPESQRTTHFSIFLSFTCRFPEIGLAPVIIHWWDFSENKPSSELGTNWGYPYQEGKHHSWHHNHSPSGADEFYWESPDRCPRCPRCPRASLPHSGDLSPACFIGQAHERSTEISDSAWTWICGYLLYIICNFI